MARFTNAVEGSGRAGTAVRDVFTGNLLADFFQSGARAAVDFGAQAIQAAAAASDANRTLEFSATQAGLSYTRAAELAEDFGRRVGASNTEATRTFAGLVRLAERSGRGEDIELISQRFSDLAAARGLRGKELQNIVQTILSGQDEGLNRLGIDDPSKLNEVFAKSLGRTADSLSITEKAQAALNAVLEKGAAATGEAEKRQASIAGQLDATSASLANLTTQFGEALTNSVEFRGALALLAEALGFLTNTHEATRRQLAKGLNPEEIAQEQAGSPFNQVADFITTQSARVLAGVNEATKFGFGEGVLNTLGFSDEAIKESITGVADRRLADIREQIKRLEAERQEQEREREQQAAASEVRRQAAEQQARADSQRTQGQTAFKGRLDDVLNVDDLNARRAQLRALKDELRELPGVFDGAGVAQQTKKIDAALDETQKKIQAVALTARDAARDFLSGALTQSDKDNPFVSLFVRAQTEIAETRRQFSIFGQDFADEMARIRAESIQTEIAVARFQSQVSALKSLQEARRLEQPLVGLTGPEERQLDVLQARLRGALSGTSGATTAEALRKGFTSVDPAFLARQQFDELEKLESRLAGFTGRAGAAARDALDEQLKSLFAGLDERTKAQVVGSPAFREKFAGAFERDQQRAERDIRDAIAREQAGNLIQQDARELLKQINQSGIKEDQKIKEFLAVTGSLSEKELTPDLRQARIRSLRESAVRETGREAQAERRAQALEKVLQKLDALLTEKGVKVDAPPSNVSVNVGDGLTVERNLLGPAPQPQTSGGDSQSGPVYPGYAPGFY